MYIFMRHEELVGSRETLIGMMKSKEIIRLQLYMQNLYVEEMYNFEWPSGGTEPKACRSEPFTICPSNGW